MAGAGGRSELDQAIAWYAELVAAGPGARDPGVALRLGVLEGEAGRCHTLLGRVAGWRAYGEPLSSFAALIEAAYLQPSREPGLARRLRPLIVATLGDGWFADRLVRRLALHTGDADLAVSADLASAARGARLLSYVRVAVSIEIALLALGGTALALVFVRLGRDPSALRGGPATLPPPWSGPLVAALLVRGAALGGLVLAGFALITLPDERLQQALGLAANVAALPLLFLAWRHLLRPAGLDPVRGFGLWPKSGGWPRLALMTLALLGAGLLGDWAVALAEGSLGRAAHWTEWFDEDLAWGSPVALAATVLDAVILAPVLEELIFRGLLFGALRVRLGPAAAALASAAVFAAAHGYGVLGFASVMWSGVLWAWAYERTGSLLPGVAAHAGNNLAASLVVMALFRA